MNGKAAYTIVPPPPRAGGVEDQWGLFDSNQAGLKAAFRAAPSLEAPAEGEGALEAGQCDELPEMIFPDDPPASIRNAPADELAAMRKAQSARRGHARLVPQAAPHDERIYDPAEPDLSAPRHNHANRGVVYSLEFPTRCPQCCSEIGVVRVSRLLRSQVSFTSTLPRKGYVIVCPECDGILSAELSGLI